jgi:hypothetical protein
MCLGCDDNATIAYGNRSPDKSAQHVEKQTIVRIQLDKVGLVGLPCVGGFLTVPGFDADRTVIFHIRFHVHGVKRNTDDKLPTAGWSPVRESKVYGAQAVRPKP